MMNDERICYGQEEGSICTPEGKERLLKEHNIIFNEMFAFKLETTQEHRALVTLYIEDDECLCRTDVTFNTHWLKSLSSLIEETERYLNK